MTSSTGNTAVKAKTTPPCPPTVLNADTTPASTAKLATIPALPTPGSKQATLVALLARPEGATLEDLVTATGWLPHTTRAALTGLKKRGHVLSSNKVADIRTYHITPREAL